MSGKTEKFFCHCGKECRVVKVIKVKNSPGSGGLKWRCENGHINSNYTTKEIKEKQ